MANTVDKVLTIAKAEVGYCEKSTSAYKKDPTILDSKTKGAGYDNYTKYGRDMHKLYPAVMDFPAAWCDCFVDWCFQKAYGVSNAKKLLAGNFDDYTCNSAGLYNNKNAFYTSNPKPGDQIFFVSAGKTREIRNICHTGLVYKVDKTTVYTIEGNTSAAVGVVANGGGVAYKQYPLNYERICGYGRPKYDVEETTKKTEVKEIAPKTETKKTIPALAKPTLKKGSKGKEVQNLQKDLNYTCGFNLVVDGDFGVNTEKALRTFQSKNKLTADCIYGPKSEAKMKTLLK